MTSRSIVNKDVYGLYAITPDETDTAELLRKVRLALQGGARILQYRNKLTDSRLKLHQAEALRQLTREFDCIYIINDDAQLAAQVDADGVHLGNEDGSALAARSLLGSSKLVGVSCYNQFLLANEAANQGADYVAFGAFYSSDTKPHAANAEADLLKTARNRLNLPIVAIGGITQQNGTILIQSGANALAVISALWNAPDIRTAAQQFSILFSKA
jgi:thiamine-phosphate pyrophosphorylase